MDNYSIGREILTYLNKFAADPTVNRQRMMGGYLRSDYEHPSVSVTVRAIWIRYRESDHAHKLDRAQAERYLIDLRSGFVGWHCDLWQNQEEKK